MSSVTEASPWRLSYHGGHSGQFCQHASGTLEAIVQAAVERGLSAFGITEHMPPMRDEDRYPDEVEAGLSARSMQDRFVRYATQTVPELQARYGDRILLLLGMETEVLPPGRYADVVDQLRSSLALQYVVGSVHHIEGECFDMSSDVYTALAERVGGLDALYLAYYRAQREMLEVLQPEVVGHFDLIRKFAPLTFQAGAAVDEAGRANLEFIADYGGVLDVNARALQRWTEPYPAREWLTQALQLGIEVTLGDDSHSPEDVGVGLDRCRDILLEIGYRYVARLEADGSRQQVPLE